RTPTPTSKPPTTPVDSRPGQLRVRRSSPSSTVRWNVSVSSSVPPWASVACPWPSGEGPAVARPFLVSALVTLGGLPAGGGPHPRTDQVGGGGSGHIHPF